MYVGLVFDGNDVLDGSDVRWEHAIPPIGSTIVINNVAFRVADVRYTAYFGRQEDATPTFEVQRCMIHTHRMGEISPSKGVKTMSQLNKEREEELAKQSIPKFESR